MKDLVANSTTETMSSRELAEMYGKPHNDTLKKVRKLEKAYVKVYGAEGNFSLSEYKDSTGRKLPGVIWGLTPFKPNKKILTMNDVSGNTVPALGKIQVPGLESRNTKRTPALFLKFGGFFMSLVHRLSLVVEQGTFGFTVLCGGIPTCSTAIFRLESENGEYSFHKGVTP